LYDGSKSPAVSALLDTLTRRTNAGGISPDKQVYASARALKPVLTELHKQVLDKKIGLGTQVIILFAPKEKEVQLKALFRYGNEPVSADKDQMIIIFLLDKSTFEMFRTADLKIDDVLSDASKFVEARMAK
jgi:hypothetical protein